MKSIILRKIVEHQKITLEEIFKHYQPQTLAKAVIFKKIRQ